MAKRQRKELKQGRGVSLYPSTWAKVDAVAEGQEKSASEVIEECVNKCYPRVPRFRKSGVESSNSEIVDLP